MSLSARFIIAFAATIAVRLGFHLVTGFTADDAFITFRYAENLASGYGFVYNAGERVLGTSTPLFAWILALLATFRVPVITGALVLSLLCSGLTAVVLYRFAINLRFGRWAWVPVLVYALWPRSLPADTSGMETALFTVLLTTAFYCLHRYLHYYAIGLATLATLTRPEGWLLLIIILAGSCLRDRARWRSLLITPLGLIVPWLLFAHFYFGSVVPHSIPAKLALYSQFGAASWLTNLIYLMAWHNPVGWAMTLLAIAGGYWLSRKQNFGRSELVWLGTMIAFFTFSRTHLFFWYVTPIYPVYILFAAAAVPAGCDRLLVLQRHPTAAAISVAIAAVAVLSAGFHRQAEHYRLEQQYANVVLQPAGEYLAGRVDIKTETIAAEDIGYLGYHSGCRMLDRDGLISPAAVPYNREGRYLDLILDRRPAWVGVTEGSPISGFTEDSRFLQFYTLQQTFGRDSTVEYAVYRAK